MQSCGILAIRGISFGSGSLSEILSTYQVLECEVGNVTRLNVKILESLRLGIDDLIDEFSHNLIAASCGPPESLVQDVGNWLHKFP